MDSIFLLVPIVIFFVACAVKFFFWAVNSGQYDDLNTEGRRILFDDDAPQSRAQSDQQAVEPDTRALQEPLLDRAHDRPGDRPGNQGEHR